MRYFSRKNVKDDFQLSIMNYELFFGRSGKAVGLSAISLLAMFPSRSKKNVPVLVPVPESRPRLAHKGCRFNP